MQNALGHLWIQQSWHQGNTPSHERILPWGRPIDSCKAGLRVDLSHRRKCSLGVARVQFTNTAIVPSLHWISELLFFFALASLLSPQNNNADISAGVRSSVKMHGGLAWWSWHVSSGVINSWSSGLGMSGRVTAHMYRVFHETPARLILRKLWIVQPKDWSRISHGQGIYLMRYRSFLIIWQLTNSHN